MNHFEEFTDARDKEGIISQTKIDLKRSFGIKASTDLIKRVINDRSDAIRQGMENKIPRMIIPGLGSIVIKKGREAALKKSGVISDPEGIFKYKFDIVTKDA